MARGVSRRSRKEHLLAVCRRNLRQVYGRPNRRRALGPRTGDRVMTSSSISIHLDGFAEIASHVANHDDGGYVAVLEVGPHPTRVTLFFENLRVLDETIARLTAARDSWVLKRAADIQLSAEGEP